ncbi:MAG: hypothetical protein ACK42H_19475 [Planctomycetota bacterium]
MFGLDHVERNQQAAESARLLNDLALKMNQAGLTPGTSVVLKDEQGNRVGIADIHG